MGTADPLGGSGVLSGAITQGVPKFSLLCVLPTSCLPRGVQSWGAAPTLQTRKQLIRTEVLPEGKNCVVAVGLAVEPEFQHLLYGPSNRDACCRMAVPLPSQSVQPPPQPEKPQEVFRSRGNCIPTANPTGSSANPRKRRFPDCLPTPTFPPVALRREPPSAFARGHRWDSCSGPGKGRPVLCISRMVQPLPKGQGSFLKSRS